MCIAFHKRVEAKARQGSLQAIEKDARRGITRANKYPPAKPEDYYCWPLKGA